MELDSDIIINELVTIGISNLLSKLLLLFVKHICNCFLISL